VVSTTAANNLISKFHILNHNMMEIDKPSYANGLVQGKNGAVAVEAEQCSNVGIDSKSSCAC
jgi:hypothetical protein